MINFVDYSPISSGLYECLLKGDAAAEEKPTDRMRQRKKRMLHKRCSFLFFCVPYSIIISMLL